MKKILIAAVALSFGTAYAGEWHAGQTNLCSDCHTMHFSMSHDWNGVSPVGTTPAQGGNWIGATGPNARLLKLPANELCKTCHDGQTFAPDVLGANSNAAPAQGRSAGALNEAGLGAPYETFKGHTLGSTAVPPGWNPTAAGIPVANQYDATKGLECISCHLQHGSATIYRNLGQRVAAIQPTYVFATTNDVTKDVWINADKALYTPNSGNAATFNPLYANANVSYNRTDPAAPTGATTHSSNRLDAFCSQCHGDYHGQTGDANIQVGGTPGVGVSDFLRHPTSGQVIGLSALGGQSSLTRFAAAAATTKVKVYANDRVGYTDATPGCVTCHKAHGNQNPFGLVFLARSAASVGEEGGFGATQTQNQMVGYRNLCGQCHGQGADSTSATTPN